MQSLTVNYKLSFKTVTKIFPIAHWYSLYQEKLGTRVTNRTRSGNHTCDGV